MPSFQKNSFIKVDDGILPITDNEDNYVKSVFANRDHLVHSIRESKLWGNIRRLGETDAGMRDLLNQCIMYYQLNSYE